MKSVDKTLIIRWIRRSGLAISDQVSVAVANFVLNVAFARWGPAQEYGAFAIAQALFLFSAVTYTALFTEPMMVFVHRDYAMRRQAYYARLLRAQGVFSISCVFGFSAIGQGAEFVGLNNLGVAFIGFAFAGPAQLAMGLMRRIYYCESRPERSALAAVIYLVLIISGVWVLIHLKAMNCLHALELTAVCSVVSMAYLALGMRLTFTKHDRKLGYREVTLLHWSYSRWSLPAGVAGWFPSNVPLLILPFCNGLGDAATFRALSNLVLPVSHVVIAVSSIAMPALARVHADSRFWRFSDTFFAIMGSFGAAYCALLIVGGPTLSHILYGGRYSESWSLICIFALSCFPQPLISAANSILRAKALPIPIFQGTIVSAIVSIAVGIPATIAFGLMGAVSSMAASYFVNASLAGWKIVRLRNDERNSSNTQAIAALDVRTIDKVIE